MQYSKWLGNMNFNRAPKKLPDKPLGYSYMTAQVPLDTVPYILEPAKSAKEP